MGKPPLSSVFPLAVLALLAAASARGAELVVTTLADTVDGDVSSVAALLADPGEDGVISLREAITACNNSPGADRITFAVAGTITLTDPLPPLSDHTGGTEILGAGITLDGSQMWALCDVEGGKCDVEDQAALDGAQLAAFCALLHITAASNRVSDFQFVTGVGAVCIQGVGANGNVVTGNRFRMPHGTFGAGDTVRVTDGASDNVIGRQGEGNEFATGAYIAVELSGAGTSGNIVAGNWFRDRVWADQGADKSTTASPNGVVVLDGASHNRIGDAELGGNAFSHFNRFAIEISDPGTSHNVVEANWIGFDPEGNLGIGNHPSYHGVLIHSGASHNRVGGPTPAQRNVIAFDGGTLVYGVGIYGASHNLVQGNLIGLTPTGEPMWRVLPGWGIQIWDSSTEFGAFTGEGNVVGGTGDGEGNVVTGYAFGVDVRDGASQVEKTAIRSNSIFNNPQGGILHTGNPPLWHQPVPPVLSGPAPVRGMAAPGAAVDFFADELGQGRIFLGTVEADGAGEFHWAGDITAHAGLNLTATQTPPGGGTSGFSASLEILKGPHKADLAGDYAVSLSELLRVVQFFNSAGFGCDPGSEDGYSLDPGDRDCAPHDADYAPQDWMIVISELLRVIQFYNSGAYHPCPGSEDGYCPGPA